MPHRVAFETHKAITILSSVIPHTEQALSNILWLLGAPSRVVPVLSASHAAHGEIVPEISDFLVVFVEISQIVFVIVFF